MEIGDDNEPYGKLLDDLNILNPSTRAEFLDSAHLFASNCYIQAEGFNMEEYEQLKGYYHWRIIKPARFFKISCIYHHSEDLILTIESVEELSDVDYIVSASNQDESQIGFYNEESDLVKNINNSDVN